MSDDLIERLNAACVGHPSAKIPWPHRLLHEAAARIRELEATTEARAQIIARNRCVVSEAEAAARIRRLEAALRVMGVNPDTLAGEGE